MPGLHLGVEFRGNNITIILLACNERGQCNRVCLCGLKGQSNGNLYHIIISSGCQNNRIRI